MEKNIKGRQIGYTICVSGEDAPGLYRSALPHSLHFYITWLRNFRFHNFANIFILGFAKFSLNFAKF